jgi:tetratricopeptide (TPR) repeat protein
MAREAQNEVGRALTSAWLAKALVFRGDAEHAVRVAEEARELARAADQQGALYTAETWCGAALLLLGEPKRAAECFERLGEINMRWPTTVDWLAVASLETGHFAEAAEHARNCLAAEPARLVRVRALRTLGLALALGRAPDFERAEQAIGDSLSIAVECGLVPYAAAAHAALAELCARRGESHRVGYYSERARREWTSCGMVAHADHAERALG